MQLTFSNYVMHVGFHTNETIPTHQCDVYEIITLRNKPVSMQENPAYGKVGSVNFV